MAVGTFFTLPGREVPESTFNLTVERARSKSATCKQVWDTIVASPVRVDFVLFSGGNNAEALVDEEATGVTAIGFNPREKYLDLLNRNRPGHATSAGFTAMPNPVVYWSPDCKYPVFTDIQPAGILVWQPNSYTLHPQPTTYMRKTTQVGAAARSVERPLVWATKVDLPTEIVLFHELGHIVQYITNKPQYVNWLSTHNINALEADNLTRHEQPICREFGLGVRANYHEDCTFLSKLPDTTFFRCAPAGSRRLLDQMIANNTSNVAFRGRNVQMVSHFSQYKLNPTDM